MAPARERPSRPARPARRRNSAASAAVDAAIADLYPVAAGCRREYARQRQPLPAGLELVAGAAAGAAAVHGWRKTARIDQAVAQLRAARAQTADREQQIYLDLSQALSQLESARRAAGADRLIVRQAQESLDLVSERYRAGRGVRAWK